MVVKLDLLIDKGILIMKKSFSLIPGYKAAFTRYSDLRVLFFFEN